LAEKSVYVYLAVLAVFPCSLKITLQCSAEKKCGNHWPSECKVKLRRTH